jgi:hypothetical protein
MGKTVAWLAALAGVGACAAAPPPTRTIEPGAASGGEEDSGFVLSRAPRKASTNHIVINIGEKWWRFRAQALGASERTVRERDEALSEVMAPETFWDDQMAREAVAVWSAVCNECHGGRRRLEDALKMPAPPPGWGKGEGLFFGARRRYADEFNIVYRGGPPKNGVPSEMPAWKGKIAKELIWALLYFLEYQSGGIEGRFPPSLYPRRSSE